MYAIGKVACGTHGGYSYSRAKLYKATLAKDGHWFWKVTNIRGPERRGFHILERDAEHLSEEFGNCRILNIRNNKVIK